MTSKKRGRHLLVRRAVSAALGSAMTALAVGPGAAAVELPVPCAAGACGTSGPSSLGGATATQAGNLLTVTQNSNASKAILNWASFNIGAGGKVNFVQPSATAIALNRIFQASPSQIFGSLTANGQIYLINQNGVIFGKGASVSTAGLVASSLNVSDAVFGAGLASSSLSANGRLTPSLAGDGRLYVQTPDGQPVTGADGQPIPVAVSVQQGASLSVTPGGRIILAGQSVENAGSISAPQGQVILAAGQNVYLQASTDPKLRGLYVEVDDAGGKVWNQLGGAITTADGNITLVGLAVNQDGRLSASTSVAANGSIRLLARANPLPNTAPEAGASPFLPQRGGTLSIGATSSISILPDADPTTAVDAVAQLPSSIELGGQKIFVAGGSTIVAPGGTLSAIAASNPSSPSTVADPAAQLRIDSGASIDLSGASVSVPVTRNLVAVDLRANELADDPLQRNGPLHGQTVVIDARVGTPIANVSGAIAGIGRTVAERLATGGTATFSSDGDVVVASGATINVSGGTVNYTGGYMQTTQLVAPDGSLVAIGSASPNVAYTGLVNPTISQSYNVWGVKQVTPTPGSGTYEAGYTDGKAAGSLSFAAPTLVLNGTLLGQAVSGSHQRSASQTVAGGQLTIGVPGGIAGVAGLDFQAPSVEFVAAAPAVAVSDGTPLPTGLTLALPTTFLTSGGFTRTGIYSNGSVTLPAGLPLALAAGSSLGVQAQRIDLGSNITDPGGALSFGAVRTVGSVAAGPRPGITVDPGVTLDVRGTWVNDLLATGAAPTAPLWQNGGSITLSLHPLGADTAAVGGELVLGDGASLLADGGAWLAATGALSGGSGGNIALLAGVQGAALSVGRNVTLEAFGVGGAKGGSLALETQRLQVVPGGDGWAPAQTLDPLDPNGNAPFFTVNDSLASQFGFAQLALVANGPVTAASPYVLEVAPGARLASSVDTLVLGADYASRASGGSVAPFASVAQLDPSLRAAGSLSLTASIARGFGPADVGGLEIAAGSTVSTDPGGAIALSSLGNITIGGTLAAPAGQVSATINVPPLAADPGYVPTLAIDVLPGAVIDVSGVRVLTPNAQSRLLGSVLDAGAVRLTADRGSVYLEPGSLVRADGTSGVLDVLPPNAGGYLRETVASNGGSITLTAAESVLLGGSLGLHGGSAVANAGTLGVTLTAQNAGNIDPNLPQLPTTPRTVTLDGGTAVPAGVPSSGSADVPVATLVASGADSVAVAADDAIVLAGSPSLTLARSITLSAPAIAVRDGGAATLNAAYVDLNGLQPVAAPPAASSGAGSLAVQAQLLDVSGPLALQGIGAATLASSGDLRLIAASVTTDAFPSYVGSLSVGGNLTLRAGQIYPTSGTTFTLAGSGADSRIEIDAQGAAPPAPLSAGGIVVITAPTIVQAGTLRAPFGSIELDASQSLTLAAGSLTSVSGAGLTVPYGVVSLGGTLWTYSNGASVPSAISTTPARVVTLNSPSVSIAAGATVDLSGGGDLTAAEFVPGTGGTKPVLDPGVTPGLYAILPSLRGQYGPYDPQTFAGSGITAGESVYLSGLPGLPAGFYPLLPASYALLPGALLVQALPNVRNLVPGVNLSQPDGSLIVPGYLSLGSTGLGATSYSGFDVHPGSYALQLASYQQYLASTFLPAQAAASGLATPDVPANAGRLAISAGNALDAQGSVITIGASGGVGASIDLAATDLVVVKAGDVAPAGAVAISDATLTAWAPASLVLGGTRSAADGSLAVVADTVAVDAGARVVAPDVTLVAGSSISVGPGAVVASTLAASGTAPPAGTLQPVALTLTGAGAPGAAFLSVSDLAERVPERPAGAASSATQIVLDPSATLAAGRALVVDTSGGAVLGGTVSGAGAAWSLNANRLVLGASAPDPDPTALTLTPTLVANLGAARAVRLAANTSIDFAGPVAIGSGTASGPLGSLTLSAPAFNQTGADDVALAAATISIVGAPGGAATAAAGTGSLLLAATDLSVGPGSLAINGFRSTTLSATDQIRATGTATLAIGGDLTLRAPRVTGASGATASVAATGDLLVDRAAGTAAVPLELGAALAFAARTVDVRGSIVAPAGIVALSATQGITIEQGAVLDASGIPVTVADRTVGASGGTISLVSGGAVTVDSGALLAVAGAGGERAGAINVNALGAASLGGPLNGAGGGSLALVAQSLADFGGLEARLAAGGFSGDRAVRVQQGDLVVGSADTLTANSVSLVTDSGALRIDGVVNATGGSSGAGIRLYAGGDVAINGTLRADAAANGVGGTIVVGSTAGAVSLATGAEVSARGPAGDGTLTVRASAAGTGLAGTGDPFLLASLPADLSGLAQVRLVPVLAPFQVGAAPGASDWAAIHSQVDSFYGASGAAIAARLNPAGSAAIVVTPGVDVVAAAGLTLGALDLSTWRFGGEPVALTVRAPGSVTLTGVVSDGFAKVGNAVQLLNQDSASISITAGAALGSADPLATVWGAAADLTLAGKGPGSGLVRTGAATIDVAAARDVVFASASNSIFSAGRPVVGGTQTGARPRVEFPADSGRVTISAGRDVVGFGPQSNPTQWYVRQGQSGDSVQWGVAFVPPAGSTRYTGFNWNVGSLGGGSVSVVAGRDVEGLSAAAAASAIAGAAGPTQLPGGSIGVVAGRNVDTSEFFVEQGTADLRAGGAFGALPATMSAAKFPEGVGSLVVVGDASVSLTARTGILFEPVVQAGLLGQTAGTDAVYFFVPGAPSSVRLESAAGSIVAASGGGSVNGNRVSELLGNFGSPDTILDVYPASVAAHALSGDIVWNTSTTFLLPSPQATFDLLAARDIVTTGQLAMSDVSPAGVTSPGNPATTLGGGVEAALETVRGGTAQPAAIHLGGDQGPALVTAGRDILGSAESPGAFQTATAARVVAGRDIVDISVIAQNLSDTDVTLISAGRDFRQDSGVINNVVSVGGPGRLDLIAGRQIDLGFSQGVETTGRLANPALPSAAGANLTMIAGLAQPIDAGRFLYYDAAKNPGGLYDPAKASAAPDPKPPLAGCAATAADCQALVDYVGAATGQSGLTLTNAVTVFAGWNPEQQRPLELNLFFADLLQSGRDATNAALVPNPGFAQGYLAIDTLFPGSRAATAGSAGGDISLAFSRIYTLAGGDIDLIAPGGILNVGLAVPPAGAPPRGAAQLGIVAEGAGNVDVYTRGDVLVNASRVFTLGGGDILVWSTLGDIDAGRGAKTALSAPPPVVLVDANGNVTLDYSATVAGSGIRTIRPTPEVGAGSVDLVAPAGFVNAGDAGIGAAGNLNIAAQQVLGLGNIQVGGTSTGVPAETSNLGASLSSASAVGASSSNAAGSALGGGPEGKDAAAPLASGALNWLDVFVTGLGEEGCKPDDLECLKRQRKN